MTNKIETKRLILRTIQLDDAKRINELCNDKAITSTTLRIPYPSQLDDTENFIKKYSSCDLEKGVIFTIFLKEANTIIGVMSLEVDSQFERGELGYWIGKKYWKMGYCTEAAKAVLNFGFNKLSLHKIFAHHMKENEASGKVLQKIGMQYEGCLREHIKKEGIFKDMMQYGILRYEN